MATVSALREGARPAQAPVMGVEEAFEAVARELAGASIDEIVIANGPDTELPVALRWRGGPDVVVRFGTRREALEFYRLAWSRLRIGP